MDGSMPAIRGSGWALLAAPLLFLVAAFITKFFGRFPLPIDPLEQLTLIATAPFGWPAHAVLFGIGALLWMPISLDRLRIFRETGVFWPHTVAILAAIGLMGVSGLLPTLGWVVAGLAVLGGGAGILLMQDWPPFLSYGIVLVLAIGLARK